MAKATKKQRKKANAIVENYLRPTPQREAHNDFRTAGMAMRVVPVIDRLLEAKVLTAEEHRALSYYRDQASLADRSPVRSCLDDTVRGTSGHGPGVTIMSAAIETGRIERNMGALWTLCRAVCVDDMTLEDWCSSRGSRANLALVEESFPKQLEAIRAKIEAGAPAPCPLDIDIATLELKYAAGGVVVR